MDFILCSLSISVFIGGLKHSARCRHFHSIYFIIRIYGGEKTLTSNALVGASKRNEIQSRKDKKNTQENGKNILWDFNYSAPLKAVA